LRCNQVTIYPVRANFTCCSWITSTIILDSWENLIEKVFDNYGIIVPTVDMVRSDIENEFKNITAETGGIAKGEIFFIDYARKFRDESIRKEGTIHTYNSTIGILSKYEAKFRTKLRFHDINITFYKKFTTWMNTETFVKKKIEYNYSKNYIAGNIKNIKLFMNESKKAGLHQYTGYENDEFRVLTEDTDSIYLTAVEIDKLFHLDITEALLIENGYDAREQNLRLAVKSLCDERDSFLTGYCTALRYSDYSRLDALNFKDDMVSIWTQKKDKKVYIPMHYILKSILQRRDNKLPVAISGQKHNDQLKALGKLAGINEDVLLTKTRGGQRENIIKKKYEFIASHTARRSGATNMYLAGIDIKYIQNILGHSKPEQTLKYIKVSAEENAKRLQNHPFFSGK